MNGWMRIDDGTNVTKAGFRSVTHKTFRMNNGREMVADIISSDSEASVGIIALTPDNRVVIATQFRCGPEKVMHEMPGGMVDSGETLEQTARRELREEVGYDSDELEYLGYAYVNAWEDMLHHYFIAKNCYKLTANDQKDIEDIEINETSISEFIHNAKTANMSDSQGVFLAYDQLKEMEILK